MSRRSEASLATDPRVAAAGQRYSVTTIDGCDVIVYHQWDHWYARCPGRGCANFGSPQSRSTMEMTIRDALSAWRHAGRPPSSGTFIPMGWREVPLDDLVSVEVLRG